MTDPDAPYSDPRREYEARRAARLEEVAEVARLEGRLANLRLALSAAAALAAWWLWGRIPLAALIGPAVLLFVVLVVVHERAKRRLERARRAAAHYEQGLARLRYDFADVGPTGARWRDSTHPYADHLDLFGTGSLFQFLSGARSAAGRETLARWLLRGADPDEIEARQEAVRELTARLDLREDLAVLEASVVEALDSESLTAWGAAPPVLRPGVLRWLAAALAGLAGAAAIAAPWIGFTALAWVLLAELALWLFLRKRVDGVLEAIERPAEALRHLHSVLERLEAERFEGERLQRVAGALGASVPPATARLEALLRRLDALEWRENQIFLPIALLLSWGTNCAYALERWRADHGREIGAWIRAVGELEALLDLARFAYERPATSFPRIIRERALFDATDLAHPLLEAGIANDVTLDDRRGLLVVTGSNMSGKSTLLRAVGTNVVLALMGAPVCASSLAVSPVSLGASIHTVDSLQEGASRFYAEIHAIKRAMDAAEEAPPGLFLLDELLHGTNSHDRRIGAGSIVRGFLEREALGIVTTHDLALAEIADELGDRAANAHFEFALEDGELRFDYRLHPGVVRTGNALEIMRAAGLEI